MFSVLGDRMFVSDTLGRRVMAYELDFAGAILTRCTIAEFDETMGLPDGLAIDADGEESGRISVPARNVTRVAFGGARLDALFFTAAADEAGGGDLYSVTQGVLGAAETRFAISTR